MKEKEAVTFLLQDWRLLFLDLIIPGLQTPPGGLSLEMRDSRPTGKEGPSTSTGRAEPKWNSSFLSLPKQTLALTTLVSPKEKPETVLTLSLLTDPAVC